MQETSVVKCRSDFLKDYRAYLKPFLLLSDLMRKLKTFLPDKTEIDLKEF